MGRTCASLLAVALLLAVAPARAETAAGAPPPGAGARRHEGFFLQLNAGLGSLGSTRSAGGIRTRLSGSGWQLSAAAGGVVAQNLALSGELWTMTVSAPRVEVGGNPATAREGSIGLRGVGAKLAYYFMPANVYVAATPSIATLRMDSGRGVETTTRRGPALRLAVGKEWWVADGWGLGGSLQYARAWNGDPGAAGATWRTSWLGIAASATYD